jgi:transposase
VRARTALGNTARGLAKSYGERLRGCNVRDMNPEKAQGLSPELRTALEPLLAGIESLSERIREYNERIEGLAQESYPHVGLLKQVKGVGTRIALTFPLTLEDAIFRSGTRSDPCISSVFNCDHDYHRALIGTAISTRAGWRSSTSAC